MLACDYRTVPATVDNGQCEEIRFDSTTLCSYVALGTGPVAFSKVGQNRVSCLTRNIVINERQKDEEQSLDIVTQSNSARGICGVSLFMRLVNSGA